MKTKIILLLIFIVNTIVVHAQQPQRDQDLITLKNGYQYLGYIIEQQPGKLLKMYRPTQNDTVSIGMEDIDKLTKVFIQTYASKKRTKKDTTLIIGRFNNKRNVYQLSYGAFISPSFYGAYAMQGASTAYYRSFNNKYFSGISFSVYGSERGYTSQTADPYDRDSETNLLVIGMFENKFRLFPKPQKRRVTTLLGLNVGYVFDGSSTERGERNIYPSDTSYYYVKTENKGNFIFQTTLAIKINPDNNSGFIIEPGYAYYSPYIKFFVSDNNMGSIPTTNPNGGPKYPIYEYQGYFRQSPHLFTFRLSYFF